jgi:hypothetical protein
MNASPVFYNYVTANNYNYLTAHNKNRIRAFIRKQNDGNLLIQNII